MVSAAKAFSKEPPRQPLTNLEAIIEDFQWRYVDRNKTDQVIAFCAAAPDFATAVTRAVEARDAGGKHHNHQSKVDITARRILGRKIIKAGMAGRMDLMDFDALHDKIDEIKPFGIGPVTVYDTAIRISAFLKIEPHSVYLHAGVRQGLRALIGGLGAIGKEKAASKLHESLRESSVPLEDFPKALRGLKADDVEDILCTYREVFQTWGVDDETD